MQLLSPQPRVAKGLQRRNQAFELTTEVRVDLGLDVLDSAFQRFGNLLVRRISRCRGSCRKKALHGLGQHVGLSRRYIVEASLRIDEPGLDQASQCAWRQLTAIVPIIGIFSPDLHAEFGGYSLTQHTEECDSRFGS